MPSRAAGSAFILLFPGARGNVNKRYGILIIWHSFSRYALYARGFRCELFLSLHYSSLLIILLKSTKDSIFWKHMQFRQLQKELKEFSLFSIVDIRKIEPHFYRSRLNEWQKKGYLKKVRRGYYIFADHNLNEAVLFSIANKIYSPSYVSFEMALANYGLIPEAVYGITSATANK